VTGPELPDIDTRLAERLEIVHDVRASPHLRAHVVNVRGFIGAAPHAGEAVAFLTAILTGPETPTPAFQAARSRSRKRRRTLLRFALAHEGDRPAMRGTPVWNAGDAVTEITRLKADDGAPWTSQVPRSPRRPCGPG
jgi:hypothetical protein